MNKANAKSNTHPEEKSGRVCSCHRPKKNRVGKGGVTILNRSHLPAGITHFEHKGYEGLSAL